MRRHLNKVFIYTFIVFINSCATVENLDSLLTLKRLGASQREIELYLKKQEKLFYRLREDTLSRRLKKGTKESSIIAKYGDPVLIKEVKNNPPAKEVLLYRHPTKYFSSDRIYLYFDKQKKLSHWEYKLSK